MQFFPIRFRRLSTFCLFFAETPTLTIFMAILCQAIMANFSKIAIMAILVWVDVAINMVTFTLIAVLSYVIGMFDHHGTDEDGANEDVESCSDVDHMSYVLPRTEDSSQFLKKKIF